MSNWRIEAGKAAWNAIKPYTKTGAKTVSEWKYKAAESRFKAANFNYKEGVKKALKKMKDIK